MVSRARKPRWCFYLQPWRGCCHGINGIYSSCTFPSLSAGRIRVVVSRGPDHMIYLGSSLVPTTSLHCAHPTRSKHIHPMEILWKSYGHFVEIPWKSHGNPLEIPACSACFIPKKPAARKSLDSSVAKEVRGAARLYFLGHSPIKLVMYWLVVWNMFYFSIYWESPSKVTNIFQRC